ncbi:unnamed protein product [Spirodela intermedia]|uniref:Thioredoxin domain-containing protein n=2 Tax=Spirodela intermedia TaxID=51605 RepID=A0A7I8IB04_SPIIN|nr:unnamed protein product [Spirodela intermedia]CAA6654584.1 unnamed protein product [Spirodela intermedia]CAA7389219.1 unnamed protein product [Spirodela intermedia]
MEFENGNVHVISTKEGWDEAISEAYENGKIVVANFSASWCAPCRSIAPLYGEMSEKFPSLTFVTVDVDKMMELSSSWEVRATPTFFFLRDGRQLDKLVGANRTELLQKVAALADPSTRSSQRSPSH